MQKLLTAITLATLTFGAAEAIAKGNGGSEQRERLRAELAESRAKAGKSETSTGFFSSLFGSADSENAEARTQKTTN
ncbi:MAG: hypothetical protein AAGC79_11560 [Pseudomonadota bacterium]